MKPPGTYTASSPIQFSPTGSYRIKECNGFIFQRCAIKLSALISTIVFDITVHIGISLKKHRGWRMMMIMMIIMMMMIDR